MGAFLRRKRTSSGASRRAEEREERDERKRIGVESETDGDPWKEDGDEEEELRREKGAKRRKLKQEI